MSVVADRKQIALNTSTGAQVVPLSLGGATPKALVFMAVSLTGAGARESQGTDLLTSYSRGYSDGNAQGCLSNAIEEGLAPDGALWNNAVVVIHDATGTVEAQVSVASVSADQVTLSIDTAPSSAYLVEVLALSGSSLTDAAVTTGTLPTGGSPSTVNDEGVGFEPDGMLIAGLIRTATFNTPSTGDAGNGVGHGVALGPTDRHGYGAGPAGWRGLAGSTTEYSESAILNYENDETWDAADPTFDASGFNLVLDTDEGHDGIYVALSLAGVSLHRETLTQPISSEETAPVTQSITGLSFEPAAALVGSANQPSGTVSGGFFVEGFAAASDDEAAVFFHIEDGVFQGDVAYATDRLLTSRDPAASGTELAGMELSSFDADGATFSWPAIDDVARQHGVLLIGPAAGGGGQTISETLTDSAQATESAADGLVSLESLTDAGQGVDALSEITTVGETVSDLAEALDSPSEGLRVQEAISDLTEAADTAGQDILLLESLSDLAEALESLSENGTATETVSDLATAADIVSNVLRAQEAITDISDALDNVSDTVSGIVSESITDAATAAETLSSIVTVLESITDAAEALDSLSEAISGVIAEAITEQAQASDQTATTLQAKNSIIDIASAGSTLTNIIQTSAAVSDITEASETLGDVLTVSRSLTDGGEATDSLTPALVLSKSLSDQADASDALNDAVKAIITIVDSSSGSDALGDVVKAVVTITESAQGTDSISITVPVSTKFVDDDNITQAVANAVEKTVSGDVTVKIV